MLTTEAEAKPAMTDFEKAMEDLIAATFRVADAQRRTAPDFEEKWKAARTSLTSARTALLAFAPADAPRWRHKKRGSTYFEVGRAELQCSSGAAPIEGDIIVVYCCEQDTKLWARPDEEFDDGRFEALPSQFEPAP